MINENETIIIDYSRLMDLRIDFAFKTFADSNPEAMTSLLNAIFANGKINRIVKSVRIKNPNLDKKSIKDKLSILAFCDNRKRNSEQGYYKKSS